MKIFVSLILYMTLLFNVNGQENLSYQKPSEEILSLVEVPLAPNVLLDDSKEFMVLRYRSPYKSSSMLL